jgi:hypothetical protein
MAYLGNSPQQNIRQRYYYNATAGQTVFSGADITGINLKYQDGKYVDVYLNGALLQNEEDYTATTKTSVTLTSPAQLNDIIEIVAYGVFSVADTVSASLGGSFGAAISVSGTVTATDFNSVSDASLKENIDTISNSQEILSKINPVSFYWKSNGAKSYGVLAQEIEQILPEIVATNGSGVKSVSYIQLIALLIDSVNSLQKEVITLKKSLPSNLKGVEDGKTFLYQDTKESPTNPKTRRRRSKKVGP